jgi:Zn-dependent metalloprotease
MAARFRLPVLGSLVVALLTATLPLTAAPGAAADHPDDPAQVARRHLAADASGAIRIEAGRSGRVTFVGTRASVGIDNPAVAPGASVVSAARAHLDRYGAALGASGGAAYLRRSVAHTAAGMDVVSYAQEVGGVPVIGGDVVVSMRADRALRSVMSTVSAVTSVRPATVAQDDAAVTARGVVARSTRARDLDVTAAGRWLLDPDVVGLRLPSGARTVWRFEVGDGAAVRQLVLVDDRTGKVLLHTDLIAHVDPDRVVCDRANVRGLDTACTSGFARAEGDPASLVPDVNSAYDLSGVVSDFYQQVAGVSLTQLLGVDIGGSPRLASTVRFCPPLGQGSCPYANAFWNGQQMFYGSGWAGADDIVGHEMTHGFIDQYSRLFYWGQSGAINESMADVIGEIVDHRHPSAGDAVDDWRLGEDSPYGALRDLAAPPTYLQPDRMTSVHYTADADYSDSGGVHTNSGVGNKTAYLISQGGTFNGQTITGIDGTDPDLSKTAVLYVDVIERLSSGADHPALAQQLDQSCQDLRAAGTAGFTAADCTAVHQAGAATELTSPPANVPTTTPADTTCPAGTTRRVLFDSEAGDPASAFTPTTGAPTGWRRGSNAFPSDTWFVDDPDATTANALVLDSGIDLPAAQQSYLSFRGWWVLDFVPSGTSADYYDGGTLELSVNGAPATAVGTGWTNGPNAVLTTKYLNPWGGRAAYSGDSRGWVQSRLDLSPYAGSNVRPRFTLLADSSYGLYGWALDDITVYTCDAPTPPPPPPPAVPSAPQAVAASGFLNGMTVFWAAPAVDPGAVAAYRVTVGGVAARTVPASTTSLGVAGLPASASSFLVTVQAVGPPGSAAPGTSITVPRGYPSIRARRHGARLTLRGSVRAAGSAVVGAVVKVQRRTASGWSTVRTVRTRSDGSYVTVVRRPRKAYYRAVFPGSPGAVGTRSARHRW